MTTIYQRSELNLLKDKISAWSNLGLLSSKCINQHYRTYDRKKINIETDESEQTMFVQTPLFQY